MAEQRVERRLAAILAADVAGYSRLMGADEEGTLSRLDAHRREFLEPTVAEHNGRIVKRTGDGLLIEFGGAVDATRCATKRANQTRALAFRWSCKPPPCLAWVGPTRPRPRARRILELEPRFSVAGFVQAHTGRAEIWNPIGSALRHVGLPE